MGRVFSSLRRELVNYNVENRASKVISKEGTVAAPKHSSTAEQINIVKKDLGLTVEDIVKKDEKLNEQLKNVFVVSEGPAPSSISTKALPLNRSTDWSDMEYGYLEPEKIPPGKVSVKSALELLSKHNEAPEKWSYDSLAKHYNLDVKFVETMIDRYRVFELHMPSNEKVQDKSKSQAKTYAQQVQLKLALHNIHKLGLVSTKYKQKAVQEPPLKEIKPT